MFIDAPQTIIYVAVGAFLLGWIVGKIGAYFGQKVSSAKRDPRDDRIRSLDADVRVAQADAAKAKAALAARETEFIEQGATVVRLAAKVNDQSQIVVTLRTDLKDSVIKTRELRMELTDRATENVRSEVMLREVQTELSVAHASTDMIATGVLDYSMAPDPPKAENLDRDKVKVGN